MKKKVMTLLTSLIIATSMVLATALPVGAISNGSEDTTHENVGAVGIDYGEYFLVVGSGTLISGDTFLTAGHVTAYLQALLNLPGEDDRHIDLNQIFISF